ncbi:MAG: molybdopterin-dependent oxidoreductase [Gammaproteobacteria bacterium]
MSTTNTLAPRSRQARITCCGCTQQCGLVATLEDERVVDLRGDREHPVSAGYLCPKGKDATDFVYHPDRLLTPKRRTGPRGSGRFEDVGWDEALDDIAARIRRVTDVHGPHSLAYSYGTFRGGDWGIGERFLNRFGSPNSCGQDKICYGPLTLAETLTYGTGPTVFTAPVAGVTRCVVLWGMRPSASAPLLWRAIRSASKAGATLIVIDPERTQEAREADLWLQPLPGRDTELALALLKLVVERDRYDVGFVREHTTGFEALRTHLAAQSLDALATACTVPLPLIERTANCITSPGPTVFNAGNGLCQTGTPVIQIGRAIACLVALTGNLGVPGGHALLGPPRDLRANGDMLDADLLPEAVRAAKLGAERLPFLGRGYAAIDAAVAAAWHDRHHTLAWMATAHEPSLWRAIETGRPYPIKALVVQHHNPLGANPNATAVARALASDMLELTVVHDLFLSPTASFADYVLPAAHWLEKPYLSFGIAFMGVFGDYVGASHAAVAPPPGVRNDYELWRDLARRLGDGAAWPARAEDFYGAMLAPAGLDFETVAAAKGPLSGSAARRAGHDDMRPPRWGTPSGKVEFASSLLEAWGLPALPTALAPHIASARDFPLWLTTGGRRIDGFHENAQQTPRYRRRHAHPDVLMHPATAARAGIADGSWCTIETPLGRVRQRARCSDALAEGVVCADRWWYPEGTGDAADAHGVFATNINVCTSDADDDIDPVMGAWLLRGLPCRIAPDA